jgi:hypothetical protein
MPIYYAVCRALSTRQPLEKRCLSRMEDESNFRDSLVNRNCTFSRLAIVAPVWGLISTPLSTLFLLNLLEQHGGRISRWVAELGSIWRGIIVGVLLIVPPTIGLIISGIALFEVRSSWQPLDGEG